MLNFIFTKTPLHFFIQSFWRDEAFSYLLAKKNLLQIIFLTARDFNPPLYYFLLHFWMGIFGSSEIALRSLSLIFYWATIYMAFLILVEILKIETKKSLFYLLLILCNPILVYYAFEARMYTMLSFLATASFYYFYKREKNNYLITTIAGLYTHYFMMVVVLTQLIVLFVEGIKKPKNFMNFRLIIYSVLIFLPWLVFFLINKQTSSFWLNPVVLPELFILPMTIFTGFENGLWRFVLSDKSFLPILIILNLIIILLIVFGLIKTNWRDKNEKHQSFFLLLWTFFPYFLVFFISFFKPLFLPRYLIFSSVGLTILIIYLLEKIKILPRLFFLLLIIILSLNYQKLEIKHRIKTDFGRSIKEIKAISKPDDLLYVTSVLDFHIAQYYFDENRVYVFDKRYEKIPDYVGKVLIPKEKLINAFPTYPKKAFILKPDATYNIVSTN